MKDLSIKTLDKSLPVKTMLKTITVPSTYIAQMFPLKHHLCTKKNKFSMENINNLNRPYLFLSLSLVSTILQYHSHTSVLNIQHRLTTHAITNSTELLQQISHKENSILLSKQAEQKTLFAKFCFTFKCNFFCCTKFSIAKTHTEIHKQKLHIYIQNTHKMLKNQLKVLKLYFCRLMIPAT